MLCAPSSKLSQFQSSSMAIFGTCEDAERALVVSGADAVMIGRAVQGRPWLPGQIARYFATGTRECSPTLREQFDLIDALYR